MKKFLKYLFFGQDINKIHIVSDDDLLQDAQFIAEAVRNNENPEKCDWIYNLAESRYNFFDSCYNSLDKKSSALLSISSVIVFLMILISVFLQFKQINVFVLASIVPTILFLILSIIKAIESRKSIVSYPPPILQDAIYYLNNSHSYLNPKASFAGRWHIICEKIRPEIHKKAILVNNSFHYFQLALCFSLLPLFVGLFVRNLEVQTHNIKQQIHFSKISDEEKLEKTKRFLPNEATCIEIKENGWIYFSLENKRFVSKNGAFLRID